MFFKLSTVIAVLAPLACAAAVIRVEQRQLAPAAACTFVVNPDGVPSGTADLSSEFNYILGVNLSKHVPEGTFTRNGNSTVTGPAEAGTYTVEQTIAADALTTAEAITIVTGWVGSTFEGPWSGVNWLVETVTC